MKENKIQLDCSLNADLHCHSYCSDGTLAPAELALRAKERGVQLWALTDHDDVSGIQEAKEASQKMGLPFLAGVEISTCFGAEGIHVVGLGVDAEHAILQQGLSAIRQGRTERAHKIAQALEKLGIKNAFEGALQYVGNPDLISRAHFSRFLVGEGVCKDNADAFNRYLRKGKPAYVEHEWVSMEACLSWIHSAKGVAVIAHPGRYQGLSKNQRKKLFAAFCALGGDGVEVVTGNHSTEEMLQYAHLAQHYGLRASRGSDFHSPSESRVDLGALPLLNSTVAPIWQVLENRILY